MLCTRRFDHFSFTVFYQTWQEHASQCAHKSYQSKILNFSSKGSFFPPNSKFCALWLSFMCSSQSTDRQLTWYCRLSLCPSVCLWRCALWLNDTSWSNSVWNEWIGSARPHHRNTTLSAVNTYTIPFPLKLTAAKICTSGMAMLCVLTMAIPM